MGCVQFLLCVQFWAAFWTRSCKMLLPFTCLSVHSWYHVTPRIVSCSSQNINALSSDDVPPKNCGILEVMRLALTGPVVCTKLLDNIPATNKQGIWLFSHFHESGNGITIFLFLVFRLYCLLLLPLPCFRMLRMSDDRNRRHHILDDPNWLSYEPRLRYELDAGYLDSVI